MDTQDQKNNYNQSKNNGRIWGGLFLLFLGGIFLMRETSFFFFPYWLFTWPMILIVIGIFTGIKHGFRGPGWLILLVIGGIFLFDQMHMDFNFQRFLVPAIIIAVGLTMILRPKRNWRNQDWNDWGSRRNVRNMDKTQEPYATNTEQSAPRQDAQSQNYSTEDFINSTSVLGGTKRIVVSKNFKGGDITCILGGAEIDLTQADINGTVVIDITTILGGAKLIVPPNWEVKSESSNVLGSLEDKRQVKSHVVDFNKVLLIKGTTFMGGIELRSF